MDPNKSRSTYSRLVRRKLEEAKMEEILAASRIVEQDSAEGRRATIAHEMQPADQDNPILSTSSEEEMDYDATKQREDELYVIDTQSVDNRNENDVFVGAERIDITESDNCSTSSDSEIQTSLDGDEDDENSAGDDGSASSVASVDEYKKEMNNSLNSKVARIAIKHKLTHVAVNDVLRLLRELGHENVNIDARTILGTTRDRSDDSFEHFGLIRGIVKKIKHGVKSGIHNLQLQISIDGLPLFRSSTTQFWPILGRIVNCVDSRPFVISVYCGPSKPPDVNAYLSPFLEECKQLEQKTITVDRRSYRVVLKSVICDAPARSFVKQIKAHTAKFGCERCVQRGLKNHAMTFPVLNAQLRNNASFRKKTNMPHHDGTSPFTDLSIDMIHGFPLDYMHLVCIGVMRKMLLLWRGEKNTALPSSRKKRRINKNTKKAKDRIHRLSQEQLAIINERIDTTSKQFTMEFNRKGRGLDVLEHWKAVELRTFLLYSGPMVLKGVLDDEKYEHFMYFHAAIRILCSPSLTTEQIQYADTLLQYFVDQFGTIYGSYQLSYNLHSLIHLASECRFQHGPLDSFSAFPFESYLGQLKSLLRGTRRPLAQLKKRLSEIELNDTFNAEMCDGNKFNFQCIKPKSVSDSYLMIDKRQLLHVTAISQANVTGIPLSFHFQNRQRACFFEVPLKSTDLQIYIANNFHKDDDQITLPITSCKDFIKCVSLTCDEDEGKLVIFPLLHNL